MTCLLHSSFSSQPILPHVSFLKPRLHIFMEKKRSWNQILNLQSPSSHQQARSSSPACKSTLRSSSLLPCLSTNSNSSWAKLSPFWISNVPESRQPPILFHFSTTTHPHTFNRRHSTLGRPPKNHTIRNPQLTTRPNPSSTQSLMPLSTASESSFPKRRTPCHSHPIPTPSPTPHLPPPSSFLHAPSPIPLHSSNPSIKPSSPNLPPKAPKASLSSPPPHRHAPASPKELS